MKQTARAVIGAAFGDEGKGLMTDYFARRHDSDDVLVVRFNGGAQAGHTVEWSNGIRHVFHTYSSGTLAGAQTFLARGFLVNPLLWLEEFRELRALEGKTGKSFKFRLLIDREAPVSTIYDMLLNRAIEKSRGEGRHGSCGAGIHETVLRSTRSHLRLLAGDLFEPNRICAIVDAIRYYAQQRAEALGLPEVDWIDNSGLRDQFIRDCLFMTTHIDLTDSRELNAWPHVIFEGAQGLLLDANNKLFFPHVTCSRTGLTNVANLCREANIDDLAVTYVTRSYLTRHGAGPLPGHNPSLSFEDRTNAENEWQGALRFAPMQAAFLNSAINADLAGIGTDLHIRPGIAVTHRDQQPISIHRDFDLRCEYESWGPTATDVDRINTDT
jgi:adenylosuccinate synthase